MKKGFRGDVPGAYIERCRQDHEPPQVGGENLGEGEFDSLRAALDEAEKIEKGKDETRGHLEWRNARL